MIGQSTGCCSGQDDYIPIGRMTNNIGVYMSIIKSEREKEENENNVCFSHSFMCQ
jgi:hypothetical protein